MTRQETIDKAVAWAVGIADDQSHGYDQQNRWGPNYDCSSFIITAWQQAGVPVKDAGASYTGNMYAAFLRCGFKDVTGLINLDTGAGLETGDVLLNVKNHTEMYIGSNRVVKASINEKGSITGGQSGDQTGREIYVSTYYNFPWDRVLRYRPEEKPVESSPVDAGKVELPEKKDDFLYHGHKYRVDINLLMYGNYGPQVLSLQQLLNAKGFGELEEDGVFGWNTKQAVIKLQEATGSRVDGEFGGESFTALWNMKEVRKK